MLRLQMDSFTYTLNVHNFFENQYGKLPFKSCDAVFIFSHADS
jgi:hypothetical protein